MRVIHFGKFYPPYRGGIETFLSSLCRGLVGQGVSCEAIVASNGVHLPRSEDGGVRVRRMRSLGAFRSMPICPGASWALRRVEADVINIHHPNPLADVSYLMARPKGRLVVSYHSDILGKRVLARMHAPFMHAVLRRADALVVSSADYAVSSPVLRLYREKVRVIPYGVEASAPVYGSTGPRPPSDMQYFFLGRLVPYKGVAVLIEALRDAPGRLWIGGSGPLENDLKALADRAGLNGRVEFLGSIDEQEKRRRLSACDVFVLPSVSRAEAFGIVLLEAMNAGRPVVVSDLPTGVRMLVEHGANGYLFPPGDAGALASVLRRLADNPNAARRMGEEGRRRTRQRWTTQRMVARYLRLYKELCSSGTRT